MAILLLTTMVVAVVAVAVTIHAVMTARDGTEDDLGFHSVAEPESLIFDGPSQSGHVPEPAFGRTTPALAVRAAAPLSKSLWASHT